MIVYGLFATHILFRIIGAVFCCKDLKLICGFLAKKGAFHHQFSCIDVDPKYMFGMNLVKIDSLVRKIELGSDIQTLALFGFRFLHESSWSHQLYSQTCYWPVQNPAKLYKVNHFTLTVNDSINTFNLTFTLEWFCVIRNSL